MFKRYGIPTVYLLVVFACGAAAGVFGHRFYELHSVSAANPRPSPEEWKKRHLAELQTALHLTPAQESKISGILDETRGEMHAFMERTRPEMDRIQKEQYAQIRALLTPEQATEYDRFHAEREKRRRQGPPPR